MLALNQLSLGFAPSSMPMVQPTAGSISAKMETVDDLKVLAKKLNPVSILDGFSLIITHLRTLLPPPC